MDALTQSYSQIKKVATGSGCIVYSAIHTATLTPVAIKAIPRNANGKFAKSYIDECSFMESIDFPFCVHFFEKIETPKYFALVMEYISSMDLREYLNFQKGLTENIAQLYFSEICLAVNYLHENGVLHNDLKLSNVVMDQNYHIRLIDFNLSKYIGSKNYITERKGGSPPYMAPEVISGSKYNFKADVWSLGVILYALISGKLPFEGANIEEIFDQIMHIKIEYPIGISSELQDLFSKIFVKDPEERISVKEIFLHPWIYQWYQKFIHLESIPKLFVGNPSSILERIIKIKEITPTIEQYFHAPKPIISMFPCRQDHFVSPKCAKISIRASKSKRRSISCAQAKIPTAPVFSLRPMTKSAAPQNTFAVDVTRIEDLIC